VTARQDVPGPDPAAAGDLSAEGLRARLSPVARAALGQLQVLARVDSSNSVLLRSASTLADRAALIADAQTAGRGRRGRAWQSPPGANLYLSLFARMHRPIRMLGGLSLALGIACVEALRAAGVEGAGIKWPNDLLVDGHKLGGLLVELAGERDGRTEAVIGLGLNLRMPQAEAAAIDQPWIDLATLGVDPARELWAARMIEALLDAVDRFDAEGLAAFATRWDALDALAGHSLRVHAADGDHEGHNGGIDAEGGLRLHTAAGERIFHSAQVSVRER
jgi:BirA family transcriptional regulator, biotin operon repressor / biotin---[acetyl-CoA-carboxylase] ligase